MKKNISRRIVNVGIGMALSCFLWGAAGAAKVDNIPPRMDKPHAASPDIAPGNAAPLDAPVE